MIRKGVKIMYEIETPQGMARFIEYDSNREKVTVEFEGTYLVEFDADKCFVRGAKVI